MSNRQLALMRARSFAITVERSGPVVVRGVSNVAVLRHVLEDLVREAGLTLTWDPESAPDLRDYLYVVSTGLLRGAAVGSALGLIVGLLVGQPLMLSKLASVVGGTFGAVDGVAGVRAGWRLRATWDRGGEPLVIVSRR